MMNMKTIIKFLLLAIILLISIVVALRYGNADISFSVICETVKKGLTSGSIVEDGSLGPYYDIIWLLRMPRIILAVCVGAGLAVSGVIMQAIVKNPLADPYILGISSGASFGATAAVLLGVGQFLGPNFIGISAFLGAFVISLMVLFISNIGGHANSVKLLLSGMALSAVCSAFSSFIVYFANNMEGIQTISYWLMGSLAGAKWEELFLLIPLLFICILFLWSQKRVLNLMLMGDDAAITMGYDLHIYRQVYLLVVAVMVGFAVYSAGMLGFVGLLIPHVVRMVMGTDHGRLIPFSAVAGAIFLVWADLGCRVILPRTELPIGILISLIGAPCFVYLMIKRTYSFGGN